MDKTLSNFDWSQLQIFLAVADHGSFSAAARALRVSQPTIGRQIQALEAALDATLFQRQTRGMALTQTGLALVPAARAMKDAAGQINLLAAGQAQSMAGTVRVTASEFISHHTLPPIIAEMRRQEPEIAIELVASDKTDNLLFREADIALRMYRPEQLDVITRHLVDLPLGLIAARSYLDRNGRPQKAADLLNHDFVGYDRDEQIIRGFREQGFDVTREFFTTRCDHQTVYWQLVQAGCGIGIGQVRHIPADADLEVLDLGLDLPVLPVWLTAHEAMRRTPRVRRVWDMLSEALLPVLS